MKLPIGKWLAMLMFPALAWNLAWAAEPSSVHGLTPDQFPKLKALIQPQEKEDKWAEIPWLANLWQARKRAAAEGKPILLWEMDGNPLGCG